MKPEALHSLSVVILVAGLFLAALGMTGTFFFGKETDRTDERGQQAVLQGLAQRVEIIQSDQAGLRERLANLDQRVAAAPGPAAPPPGSELAATLPPIAEGPPTSPARPAGDLARREGPPPATGPAADAPPATAGEGKSGPPLTELQHAGLVKSLRAHPGRAIVIRAEAGEARAVELAMALRAAFRDAGWVVASVQLDSKRAPFPGLSLSTGAFPPPKDFIAAFGALEAAGLRVVSNLDPDQGGDRVVLSVGAPR